MTIASQDLWTEAQKVIPGGVNSPVRAFKGVGGNPLFITKGEGPYIFDTQGKRYIDYIGAWGPLILGHVHPVVVAAAQQVLTQGWSFGAPTPIEVEMALCLTQLMPSLEMVRMVNSGTEATLTAIRLARGATGRKKILKFQGCYHGHSDCLLVQAGSGLLTLGIPECPGVLEDTVQHTLVASFNNLPSVETLFQKHGHDIAALIVEPVAANMNCIAPEPGFLAGLRQICDQYGSLLIFDEVITGFRVALGGAQARYGIKPDLTCLGKIIGGGMPVGAFGGKKSLMQLLAPMGKVYQAGTLSGNPLALTAGLATLKELQKPGTYELLEKNAQYLTAGLRAAAAKNKIPVFVHHIGGLFGLFFSTTAVRCFEEVMACDVERFKCFFQGMLQKGIYLAPSAFEAGFLSLAHSQEVLDETIQAAEQVFQTL